MTARALTARALLAVALIAIATSAAANPVAANPKAVDKARPAVGDRRRIVGILDVHLDGVPKAIAQQFQTDLEAKLDSNAYWLAPEPRMKDMLGNSTKWTDGCVVGACLSEVKVQTGADIVLLASITGAGTSFGYVVTLMRTDTGSFVAQESNRCDVCTVKEALASATTAAVNLVTALPDKLPDAAAEQRAAFELTRTKLEAAHERTKSRRRTVGFALAVTGLIIAGAGLTAYVTQDHAPYGLATAGAGAGLALGGVVALTF